MTVQDRRRGMSTSPSPACPAEMKEKHTVHIRKSVCYLSPPSVPCRARDKVHDDDTASIWEAIGKDWSDSEEADDIIIDGWGDGSGHSQYYPQQMLQARREQRRRQRDHEHQQEQQPHRQRQRHEELQERRLYAVAAAATTTRPRRPRSRSFGRDDRFRPRLLCRLGIMYTDPSSTTSSPRILSEDDHLIPSSSMPTDPPLLPPAVSSSSPQPLPLVASVAFPPPSPPKFRDPTSSTIFQARQATLATSSAQVALTKFLGRISARIQNCGMAERLRRQQQHHKQEASLDAVGLHSNKIVLGCQRGAADAGTTTARGAGAGAGAGAAPMTTASGTSGTSSSSSRWVLLRDAHRVKLPLNTDDRNEWRDLEDGYDYYDDCHKDKDDDGGPHDGFPLYGEARHDIVYCEDDEDSSDCSTVPSSPPPQVVLQSSSSLGSSTSVACYPGFDCMPADDEEDRRRENNKKGRGVRFDPNVTGVEIPGHGSYTPEEKDQMWTNSNDIRYNAMRNQREYFYESWDWRYVLEEDSFYTDQTGRLVHPAHVRTIPVADDDADEDTDDSSSSDSDEEDSEFFDAGKQHHMSVVFKALVGELSFDSI